MTEFGLNFALGVFTVWALVDIIVKAINLGEREK